MIEVKGISKSFSGQMVLSDVTTSFDKGKTNLIIGQSGSGKTVLMKCCIGLFDVDEGEVIFNGRCFSGLKEKQKKDTRKEMGVLFQGGALFDSYTVEENIMFPLNMFTKQSYEEKLLRVNDVLSHVQLINANAKFPAELSGGMIKRVAIARAIAMNPQYLFCDEPNSGLDPKTAEVIDELISELTHKFQMTTVINTHDMNSVFTKLGRKIAFINNGKIMVGRR